MGKNLFSIICSDSKIFCGGFKIYFYSTYQGSELGSAGAGNFGRRKGFLFNFDFYVSKATKVSGEPNKMNIHVANINSNELNANRVGEVTKWKTTASDVASRPFKVDSLKAAAQDFNLKGSKLSLSPVEEVK